MCSPEFYPLYHPQSQRGQKSWKRITFIDAGQIEPIDSPEEIFPETSESRRPK